MDNISKMIRSGRKGQMECRRRKLYATAQSPSLPPFSVNIPMQFYFKGKVWDGWLNLVNPFRGTILIGTPGSGKSFGIVNPFIRQLIAKEFCCCVYDFKYPDLGKIAYYHYLLAKQNGKCLKHSFYVINLNDVGGDCRSTNPWRSDYLKTLADASESAEALVEALKKGDKAGSSGQFFTRNPQSISSRPAFISLANMGRRKIFQFATRFMLSKPLLPGDF